jgi:spermidine/putrescine transport system permease protein
VKLARWLAAPSLTWFLFFILAPLMLIFAISVAHRGIYGQIEWSFSFFNYFSLVSPLMLKIFLKTIVFAASTAIACVALGVLAAWAMAAASRVYRDLLLALIVVPFLTNGLIRILGLKAFVSVDGPLDFILNLLYIPHDPFALSSNSILVAVGMVTSYLPFAVLPLYGAFEKFDFSLIEAAQDLGARNRTVLFRVVLPVLSKPILGAGFLVFIPCLGEYLIPDLLGGAKALLLGNLITEKFLKARDWPVGAALAMGLIFCLLALWIILSYIERMKKHEEE